MKNPSLKELQDRLFTLISARESLPEALTVRGWDESAINGFVNGDERLSATGRVDIYNGMFFLRILDSLKEDFGAVLAVLGDDDFYDMTGDYLQIGPNGSPSLRNASAALPGFLGEWVKHKDRPHWLADLAAVHWAMVDVFDDAGGPLMTAQEVQSRDPATLAEMPMRWIDAHRMVAVAAQIESTISAFMQADEDDETPLPAPEPGTDTIVVWRQGSHPMYRSAVSGEDEVAAAMQAGTTFGALCEALGNNRDETEAAQLAVSLLGRWIGEGVLRSAGH